MIDYTSPDYAAFRRGYEREAMRHGAAIGISQCVWQPPALAPETVAAIEQDCRLFYRWHHEMMAAEWALWVKEHLAQSALRIVAYNAAGTAFYQARSDFGIGFDRESFPPAWQQLQDHCLRVWCDPAPYIGADGLLYQRGAEDGVPWPPHNFTPANDAEPIRPRSAVVGVQWNIVLAVFAAAACGAAVLAALIAATPDIIPIFRGR